MRSFLTHFVTVLILLTLTACGGSSSNTNDTQYTGKASPADFNDIEHKKNFSISSLNAIVEVIAIGDTDEFIRKSSATYAGSTLQGEVERVSNKALSKVKELSLNYSPAETNYFDKEACKSGEASYSANINEKTGFGSLSVSFKNCQYNHENDGYKFKNGKLILNFSEKHTRVEFLDFEKKEKLNDKVEAYKLNGFYNIKGQNFNYNTGIEFKKLRKNNENEMPGSFLDMSNSSIFNVSSGKGSSFNYDDGVIEDETILNKMATSTERNMYGDINSNSFISKGSMKCTFGKCSFFGIVEAENKKIFKVDNFSVSKKPYDALPDAQGKIFHPEYGHYDFTLSITDKCNYEEKPHFVGTAIFTDSLDNKITYNSEACSSEPTVTY